MQSAASLGRWADHPEDVEEGAFAREPWTAMNLDLSVRDICGADDCAAVECSFFLLSEKGRPDEMQARLEGLNDGAQDLNQVNIDGSTDSSRHGEDNTCLVSSVPALHTP